MESLNWLYRILLTVQKPIGVEGVSVLIIIRFGDKILYGITLRQFTIFVGADSNKDNKKVF